MSEETRPEKIRLFVAVELPQKIKKQLQELQDQLRKFALDAKWVKSEGIHLTLKFLGYVPKQEIPSITDALQSATKGYTAFSIRLNGCGFFPNARRPAVLWCGVVCETLGDLQQDIESRMAGLGFAKETRAFSPHLTLARFRDPHGLIWLAKEVEKIKDSNWGEFDANEIILYQSILHRTGAEYRALERFPLGMRAGLRPAPTD